MRKILCALYTVVMIFSCSRESIDVPKPQADPLLKRTVQIDASGNVMRVAYYNEFELVSIDTSFASGAPGMINVSTYNAKGKRTRLETTIPILYTGGFYWAYQDYYQDDTLPIVHYRYLRGNQVARIAHFYNASRQLILDSTYHTPNYGTFTYLNKFEYDMSGRLSSSLDLNDTRDTTSYTTYQYALNKVEKTVINFNYSAFKTYSKTVTEYTASGKILSEKGYSGEPFQFVTQTDYTYDGTGHLLKKTVLSMTGSAPQEERYFNNSISGKPEKMEYYLDNQLRYTVTYYYE
jgi:hypothetical protein